MKAVKIIILCLVLLNITLPTGIMGQTAPIKPPENLDEVKQMGEKTLKVARRDLPGIIENIWKNEVLPVWKKMFNWTKSNIWDDWLSLWFKKIWSSTISIFKGEVEERKPAIKEEFKKEKQEVKEEAPKIGKSIWKKFLEIIR